MLHSMTIRLIIVDQTETFYLCNGVKCQSGVIWGPWGQKVILTKNAFLATLHSKAIRIIFVDQLETVYLHYGVKSVWGHLGSKGSKGHFQQKLYFCYRIHGIVSMCSMLSMLLSNKVEETA